MVRSSRVPVDDILQHLDSDDSLGYGMDGGSGDDLGMKTDYEYCGVFVWCDGVM